MSEPTGRSPASGSSAQSSLFDAASSSHRPLADRMRPRTLEQFLGQEHLLGPGQPLRQAIERGAIHSLVLWGPPGSGKTTLAYLIARYSDRYFEPFSAVTEGVQRVRQIVEQAQARLRYEGRGTILFCDEIHRFNQAQQDAQAKGGDRFPLSCSDVEAVLARRLPKYDRAGEEHFNLISALHKAVRGSDVEGALYWLARMLAGGRGSSLCGAAAGSYGERGHRPGGSSGTLGGAGGQGGLSLFGLARGRACPGGGGDLFGHCAQVESGL